ncbi:MAG: hypothetical protein ACUVTU_06260 [Desulfurispora sp.]|uniref:hypothetical protein n=1 Tax=Desulfurispora sp. TaxID=3014275 RepID=UPI004049A941
MAIFAGWERAFYIPVILHSRGDEKTKRLGFKAFCISESSAAKSKCDQALPE